MTKNEIKYYSVLRQKKFRDSENKFLIEGEHLIEECLESRFYKDNLEKIFIRDNFGNKALLKKISVAKSAVEIVSLNERSFQQLSETVNSQGIIGVVSKLNSYSSGDGLKINSIVALDSINDPGNLGTIIRTCYWFGIDKILISTDSVELFNSKVIRASQGALFNVDITDKVDLDEKLKTLSARQYKIILTDLSSDNDLSDYSFNKNEKYVFVFGNEARGINKKILDSEKYDKIMIGGFSDCESLNIAVSAGIVLNSFKNNKK